MAPLTSFLLTTCILPLASAFYPYIPPGYEPSLDTRSISQPSPRSFRIPFTRIARRANQYAMVRATAPAGKDSLGVDQDGTDFSYFVAITLGTSTEPYYLLLDSAASSTWVMSSTCTTDACNMHNSFGATDSTSLKVSQTPFSIVYGTGQVSGFLGTDTAHIASFQVPLTFGLAYNVSTEFTNYPMDGILGLGRPNTAPGSIGAPSVIETLASSKAIAHKLFGVHFWRSADGGPNDGEITFGSADSSKFDGELTYVSTVTNQLGFWEVPSDDIGVNGKMLGLEGRTAIIDTGTSFLLMPAGDASKLHGAIPGSAPNGEQFTVPCSSTAVIQVAFAGKSFSILPKDYVGAQSSGDTCMSLIIGRQTFGANQWLFGVVFLKNVYTVFDLDGSRIGFGTKAVSASSSQTSAKPSVPNQQTPSGAKSTTDSKTSGQSSSPQAVIPASSSTGTSTSKTPGSTAVASSADHNSAKLPWEPPHSMFGLATLLLVASFVL